MNPYEESCYSVKDNAGHAFIDEEKLEKIAVELASKDFKCPAWREPVYPESDDTIIEFFGVINAINFCFTDFKTGKKFDVDYPEGSGKIWTGAFAMTAAIKRAVEDGLDILDPAVLYNLTQERVERIFRHVSTPIPMLKERLNNLRDIGFTIKTRLGSFRKLFEDSDYRLNLGSDGIVERLSACESYSDYCWHDGRKIYFNKRAQLFPMMYYGRALSSGGRLTPIQDPENFGALADYEVPKILRHFGVLHYIGTLGKIVDAGLVLEKNGFMEIEIRAQTVNAMLALLYKINGKRSFDGLQPITMAELDYVIWNMGRSPEFKSILHHRVYTTAY